jgi:hypothetical protein
VHFSEKPYPEYLTGIREPISIRIDTGLYSAFKPLSKRVYGSTCHAVEVYMIGFVETIQRGGVHFSNTVQPIKIDNIVIERNIRERRKLEIETEVTERVFVSCTVGNGNCKNEAIAKGIWKQNKREYSLCKNHYERAKSNPENWISIEPFSEQGFSER